MSIIATSATMLPMVVIVNDGDASKKLWVGNIETKNPAATCIFEQTDKNNDNIAGDEKKS